MTEIRAWKAKGGKYSLRQYVEKEPEDFYQFALSHRGIVEKFRKLGFELVGQQGLDGFKDLKDKIDFLKVPLQKIYDSSSFFARATKKVWNKIFSNWCDHSCLLLFKRK